MSKKYPGNIITANAPAGYSAYMDGSASNITVGSGTTSFTGDFTIEMWFNPIAVASDQYLFDSAPTLNTFYVEYYSGSIYFAYNAAQICPSTAVTLAAGNWYHIAVVRSGSATNNCSLYVNGVRISQGTKTGTMTTGSGGWTIGSAGNLAYRCNGYISNFRVVNGTALYSGTSFPVPTQLLNVANTNVLTCNSPAFVDQASGYTITTVAPAKMTTVSPFPAYVPYNPSLGASTPGIWTVSDAEYAMATRQWNMYDPYYNQTVLSLHGNGENTANNNTFLDSSSNAFAITRNGSATQGSFTPFSQVPGYWGVYADTAYQGFSGSTALIGSSVTTFTAEAWVYMTAAPASADGVPCLIGMDAQYNSSVYLSFGPNASRQLVLRWFDGASKTATGGTVLNLNTWYHIAVVSNANSLAMYVNGVAETLTGTTTLTNRNSTTNAFSLLQNSSASAYQFKGYVSNIRVTNTAVYTSGFTPSTAALTAVTGTQLLTAQSNRFVDNSSNTYTLTVIGSPSVQPFSPFYNPTAYTPAANGGSGYFATTSDYLSCTPGSAQAFGTGDFTVECWLYSTVSACNIMQPSASTNTWGFLTFSNQLYWQFNGGNIFGAGTVPNNSWTHLAVCRASGTLSGYVNGVRVYNAADSSNYSGTPTRYIGPGAGGSAPFYLTGARVITGTAAYSGASFTLPSAPPTAVTNTSLLTNFSNAGVADSTGKNDLVTVGSAQISTAQSKFGGSSMAFDGTGDYLTVPNVQQIVGTINSSCSLTIECWIYQTQRQTGGESAMLGDMNPTGGTNNWAFGPNPSGYLQFYTYPSGSQTGTTTQIPLNTWTHIAVSIQSGTIRLFVNGVLQSYSGSATAGTPGSLGYLTIGQWNNGGTGYGYYGYIDDLRITKGVARYTSTFTPQTSQWQDQ